MDIRLTNNSYANNISTGSAYTPTLYCSNSSGCNTYIDNGTTAVPTPLIYIYEPVVHNSSTAYINYDSCVQNNDISVWILDAFGNQINLCVNNCDFFIDVLNHTILFLKDSTMNNPVIYKIKNFDISLKDYNSKIYFEQRKKSKKIVFGNNSLSNYYVFHSNRLDCILRAIEGNIYIHKNKATIYNGFEWVVYEIEDINMKLEKFSNFSELKKTRLERQLLIEKIKPKENNTTFNNQNNVFIGCDFCTGTTTVTYCTSFVDNTF